MNAYALKTFALCLVLFSLPAAGATILASPNGTANGDGSLTNPLSLAAAIDLADKTEMTEISLLAGTYSSDKPLVLKSGEILKGASQQSLLVMDIHVESDAMLADLQVIGTTKINNNHCLLVKDVKFARECEDVGLVGLWYGPDGKQHVSGLTLEEPESGDQAPCWTAVTNYIAKLVAQPDGPGKTSNAGGIYDFVNAVSNALYMIMQEGDAAVSNFARSYTDTATNALAQALASHISNEGGVTLTGNTLVIEAACAPPTPPPGAQEAALNARPHSVYGEHVTASLNGEIAFIDLAIEVNSPASIVVTSGRDNVPVASVARQVLDATWYRYELSPHVPIEAGNWYTIAFPGNTALMLTCVDGGFAQGYAMTRTPGVDPGYDIQFRTMIFEWTQQTTPLYVKKSGDTMTGPLEVEGSLTVRDTQGTKQTMSMSKTGGASPVLLTNWGFCLPLGCQINSMSIKLVGVVTVPPAGVQTWLIEVTEGGHTLLSEDVIMYVDASGQFTLTFGGGSDYWGIPLVPKLINSGSFGVRVRHTEAEGSLTLETVGVTAEYTPVVGGIDATCVRLSGTPQEPNHATTKEYVDSLGIYQADQRTPGTVSEDQSPGIPWSNPQNCLALDNQYAQASSGRSTTLSLANWGFSVPQGVQICGVGVRLVHKSTPADVVYGAFLIPLSDPRHPGSEHRGACDPDGTTVMGGNGDLWGSYLTPEIVNSADFALAFYITVMGGPFYLDAVEMTIYYAHPFGTIQAQSILLTDEPTEPNSVATKNYVDSREFSTENLVDGSVTAAKLASDVDGRYVCKDSADEQVMDGSLSVNGPVSASAVNTATLSVDGEWAVQNQPITLMGSAARITSADTDIRLAPVGGSVKIEGELKLRDNANGGNGQAGRGTAQGVSTRIPCTACTPNSLVIITPRANTDTTDNGVANHYWVEPDAAGGGFFVHQAEDLTWDFYYLVFNTVTP